MLQISSDGSIDSPRLQTRWQRRRPATQSRTSLISDPHRTCFEQRRQRRLRHVSAQGARLSGHGSCSPYTYTRSAIARVISVDGLINRNAVALGAVPEPERNRDRLDRVVTAMSGPEPVGTSLKPRARLRSSALASLLHTYPSARYSQRPLPRICLRDVNPA